MFAPVILCLVGVLISIAGQYVTDKITEHIQPPHWNLEYPILKNETEDKVDIKLYYETLCPYCQMFFTQQLAPTVSLLSQYLDINLYPYGHAKTIIYENGTLDFECQHGERECYGNKLHACAIDQIANITSSVIFNACTMDDSQDGHCSDDNAADKCANIHDLDSERIKQCAKGAKGNELLKYYGEESNKTYYKYVPHILINGVQNDGKNFKRDVCAVFSVAPPACKD